MQRRTLLLILIFVFASGCIDEYDDGPFISLRSHYGRLKGTWDLEVLNVGGIDSTAYAKTQSCYAKLDFTDEDDTYFGTGEKIIHTSGTSDSCSAMGGYKLTDGSDNLTLIMGQIDNYIPIGPYRVNERIKWSINKLSGSQLWLEVNYNGMNCSMHLKKD